MSCRGCLCSKGLQLRFYPAGGSAHQTQGWGLGTQRARPTAPSILDHGFLPHSPATPADTHHPWAWKDLEGPISPSLGAGREYGSAALILNRSVPKYL